MNIGKLSDEDLLARGYHWKIGLHKGTRRVHHIEAIRSEAPSMFHKMVITPKFWLPFWLVLLIFRCFRVGFAVDHRTKIEVWLAASDPDGLSVTWDKKG